MYTIDAPEDDCCQHRVQISVVAANVPQPYGNHEEDFNDNKYHPRKEEATVVTSDSYDEHQCEHKEDDAEPHRASSCCLCSFGGKLEIWTEEVISSSSINGIYGVEYE